MLITPALIIPKPYNDKGWLCYNIQAYIGQKSVGYLNIAYMSRKRFRVLCPTVIEYMKLHRGCYSDDEDVRTHHEESYHKFRVYHVDKPEIDFIHVDKEHRSKGIGTKLYLAGAKFCKNNLGHNLHASSLQSDEAKAVWKRMESNGFVRRKNNRKYLVFAKK